MLNEKNIGLRFYDYQYNIQEVLAINPHFNAYVANDPNRGNDRIYGELYSEEDLQKILSKQETFKRRLAAIEKEEKEAAEREQIETENKINLCNLYGFCDGMSKIQQARVTDILTKQILRDNELTTRKEFIVSCLNSGGHIEKKDNVITYYGSKWDRKESKPKTEYRLFCDNSSFYTITKTEYKFAEYMQNKAKESV